MRILFGVPLLLTVGGLLASCESESKAPDQPTDSSIVPLSSAEKLVRVSMAIRGARPSAEELQAIQADPSQLEQLADGYLASEDFGATIRDVFNEALKLRVPAALYPAGFAAAGELAGEDVQRINMSVTS